MSKGVAVYRDGAVYRVVYGGQAGDTVGDEAGKVDWGQVIEYSECHASIVGVCKASLV